MERIENPRGMALRDIDRNHTLVRGALHGRELLICGLSRMEMWSCDVWMDVNDVDPYAFEAQL